MTYHLRQGGYVFAFVCLSVSRITQEFVDEHCYYMNFIRDVEFVTNNKSVDFGADPDLETVPGILTEFLPQRDRGNCKNFCVQVHKYC